MFISLSIIKNVIESQVMFDKIYIIDAHRVSVIFILFFLPNLQ